MLAEADDPASRLLQCLVADITRVAKQLADRSPEGTVRSSAVPVVGRDRELGAAARAAHLRVAYGGSGIVTIAVIQSRCRWPAPRAWTRPRRSGIPARNQLARLHRPRRRDLRGKGDPGRSHSEQTRTRAVLETGEIRGLPEGLMMFYKGLDPMLVRMTAYYRRPDRRQLNEARAAVEQAIGPAGSGPRRAKRAPTASFVDCRSSAGGLHGPQARGVIVRGRRRRVPQHRRPVRAARGFVLLIEPAEKVFGLPSFRGRPGAVTRDPGAPLRDHR